jgi:hypothetical protein
LKTKLKTFKVLDGIPTLNEQESTKKKKKLAGSQLGTYGQPAAVDYAAMVADMNENFTLDLHLRVLQNIDGVYLTEETCKPEILEALTDDSQKSSIFWLAYEDHKGRQIESDKKVWIQNFSVDIATGIGKTDFNYKIRIIEKPSKALSEWMKKDLFLDLWETRPKLVEKRNEETLEIYKEVQLDANNVPMVERKH